MNQKKKKQLLIWEGWVTKAPKDKQKTSRVTPGVFVYFFKIYDIIGYRPVRKFSVI